MYLCEKPVVYIFGMATTIIKGWHEEIFAQNFNKFTDQYEYLKLHFIK